MKITSLYLVLLVFMMLGVNKAYAQPQYFEEPVTIVATGNTGGGSSSVWISLGPVLQYDPLYGGTAPTWGTNGDPTSGGGSTGNNDPGGTATDPSSDMCPDNLQFVPVGYNSQTAEISNVGFTAVKYSSSGGITQSVIVDLGTTCVQISNSALTGSITAAELFADAFNKAKNTVEQRLKDNKISNPTTLTLQQELKYAIQQELGFNTFSSPNGCASNSGDIPHSVAGYGC
ncbi:MAG: hypothetical protein AAFN93_19895 [Bacteroidota bacterium]